ncbi:MAG: metal ABC transporter solute-binding protein, Zn/Mn family [bacterium]
MFKRFLLFLTLGLSMLLYFPLYSQNKNSMNYNDKNYIFTFSLNPYYGLMLDLIGNNFEGIVLIDSFDHHHFDMSPNKMKKIKNSDMIFITGTLEIEKELIKVLDPKKVTNFSKYVSVLNDDPHIWVSVKNFLKIIDATYKYLYSQKKYRNSDFYISYKKLRLKYEKLDQELEKAFQKIRKQQDFIYSIHQEFNYLARDYLVKVEPLFYYEEDISYKNLKNFVALTNRYKNKKFYLIIPPHYDEKIISYIKKNSSNVIFVSFNSNSVNFYDEFKKLAKAILMENNLGNY